MAMGKDIFVALIPHDCVIHPLAVFAAGFPGSRGPMGRRGKRKEEEHDEGGRFLEIGGRLGPLSEVGRGKT